MIENINEIKVLFEGNMKIGKKIIYNFHLQICFNYIKELMENNKVIIKSGFIRNIIYIILNKNSILYKLEIVSYKKIRSLCRWYRGAKSYTPNIILGYIK